MLTPAATVSTLLAENADLRARLEEVEQTLHAIRSGEVDALVVESDAGPQLYTLQGLDAEQTRLRGEMLAQVSDAVFAVDGGERVTFLNAAAEHMYSVRSSDVLGRKLAEIATRSWPNPEAEARMLAALHARGEWRGELIHRTFDGREFPVEVSVTVIKGSDGTCAGCVLSIRDMTRRKKIEQKMAETLRVLDALLAHAPVGFAFIDRDLRFVRINERLAEMNGYPVEAHLGKTVAEIVPTLEASTREVTEKILATGKPVINYQFIGETARAPGIIRHWNESWYPVRNEREEIIGFGAVVSDITERKQSEAALRRNAALFSEIITQAPGGVYVVDGQFRLVHMNPESLKIFASVQPLIGRDFDEALEILWGPEIGPQCASIFRHTLATGERYVSPRFSERRHDIGLEQAFEWETQRITLPDGQHGVVCYFQDVTARERDAAALRLTNERFDLAVKVSKVVLFQQDLELRYCWVHNPALDLESADIVGKRDADLMERAEDAALLEAIKRGVIHSGVGQRREVIVHFKNAALHFDLLVEPLRDAAGLICGVTCAAIDITERKRAEAAREESESRLRYALQAVTAGVWEWDIFSGELFWSPENYALYDIDPAQGSLRFEDWVSRLHPEDRDRVNEHMRAVLDGREAEFRTEFRIVCRQGAVRWLLGLGRLERDRDGQPQRMSGLNLDITARKLAEVARLETERNYRALASASSEVAYQMSADWSSMQPLEGRELVGSSDRALANWAWLDQNVPRDEHARVRQAISDAMARKGLFELEHRVLHSDGSIGWTLSRAVPILDENQSVVAWFGAASDITQRKRIELDLISATAAAKKANRAKSEFLSGMSHELRTPLNAILGFAQLLESGTPAPTPTQRRNLGQIIKGGWYLLDLINEILDLALIESGKLALTQEPISLAELMLECRAMFKPQARKRGINMTFPAFEVPAYVRADRTRLKQVLINLLSNAIKYNKTQGAVTVEYTLSPPDAIRVSVRDTGEGLAPEKLAQLFQPFNRLGKEAGAEEGTGIGLVMSRQLVELMGGTIGVDSEIGVGSVFWFELKRASAPQAARQQAARVRAQARAQVSPGTPTRTVLCVEDNAANLALIEQLMTRRPDLRLLSARDGNKGMELARAHGPQVILLDINLPGISGIEVMKTLQADLFTAHIPIVALSANALPSDIEDGMKSGFFNYITKPFEVTQFMDALDEALEFSQIETIRATGKEKA